jgi:hypothetical protein
MALAAAVPAGRTVAAETVVTDAQFCARAQRLVAGTSVPARNVVHGDYESFKKSKPGIRPLETHQFVLLESGAGRRPLRVSCKLKSADQILEEHGAASARAPDRSCADVNRDTVERVYASFTPAERARLAVPRDRIVFDEDSNQIMGSRWVSPYDFAYKRPDGRLHLHARSLHVEWTNIWFAWAPDRVRGVHYCHLIAPEYLRRLALGN